MAEEIGKIYLQTFVDGTGQTIEPEISLKNNFRELERKEKIRLLSILLADLMHLKVYLEEIPDEATYDNFFRSIPEDSPKWKKQRGLT
jgi:hypothetical protein